MTKRPLKKRTVSDAESELWNHVISDVEPLAKSRRSENLPPEPPEPPAPGKPSGRRSAPSARPAPDAPDALRHASAPGLDRATQRKMRRGKVAIEARIDLHGMVQSEAHDALEDFLCDCQAAGRRTVLVITGKGVGGEGVLRAAVPKWLNQGAARRMVRAFSFASAKDGGHGALYVMLKRLK